MSARNNGGSAFPSKFSLGRDGYGNEGFGVEQGMTLRDWFAGQAPVDWGMAQQAAGLGATVSPADRLKLWDAMAILRYEYADAMLAERQKGGA